VLTFDTEKTLEQEGNRQSFDILVKDLSIDKLMPVLILNSPDGEVAFDRFNGFYYTQTSGPDGGSRGARVYRHQLGTLHVEDVLIYEEKNPDFNVSGMPNKSNTSFS
jgi:protease II